MLFLEQLTQWQSPSFSTSGLWSFACLRETVVDLLEMAGRRSQFDRVRAIPKQARAANDVSINLDQFDDEDIAPAVMLMDISERANSVPVRGEQEPLSIDGQSANHRTLIPGADEPLAIQASHDSCPAMDNSHGAYAGSSRKKPGDTKVEVHSGCDHWRGSGVDSVLDLNGTEDTEYYVNETPAAVHDTIVQPVHEVVHEVHEREIHQDVDLHRILPVENVEVLPKRHFVEDKDGKRRELSAQDVPGRAAESLDRMLARRLKAAPSSEGEADRHRDFTARNFHGNEADYKEFVDGAGILRSDQFWVHPPKLADSDHDLKDTYEVHFE